MGLYKQETLTSATYTYLEPGGQTNNNDNTGSLQVSGTFTTAVGSVQVSYDPLSTAVGSAVWNNVDLLREDTFAIENTPTLTNSTTRSWSFSVKNVQRVRFNVASGTITSMVTTLVTSYQPTSPFAGVGSVSSVSGALTITSTSSNALAVGPNGSTNPVLQVSGATASQADGLKITGAAAGSGVALLGITSGTNAPMTIDAAGNGIITFQATGTGVVKFGVNVLPNASDGSALGTTALQWSDLFLAEGGVINWDNGDVTITQTNNVLAVAGTTSTTFDGQVNPATNDAASLGTTALGWSDLFMATGGVINFANGEVTITETDANTLTIAGTTLVAFGATTINVTGTRIVTSYHTNLVSTNAVTVDSSETVKHDIVSYDGDALATIEAMDIITYKHEEWLDKDQQTKLGIRAESVDEDLALDQIPHNNGVDHYPGVNTYALAALHTKAIQQLSRKVRELEEAAA